VPTTKEGSNLCLENIVADINALQYTRLKKTAHVKLQTN